MKTPDPPNTPQDDFLLRPETVRLERDANGTVRARVGERDGTIGSMAMAFPLSRRLRMIALRDEQGNEIGILPDIAGLDAASQRIVEEELESSYFLPRILDVLDAHDALGLTTWTVRTDRGPRSFEMRYVRRNLRRLGRRRLVLMDVDGNRYDIPDWRKLPPAAQALIDHYL